MKSLLLTISLLWDMPFKWVVWLVSQLQLATWERLEEIKSMHRWTKIRCRCLSRDILNFPTSWSIAREKVEHTCNLERFSRKRVITTQVQSISIAQWKFLKIAKTTTWRKRQRSTSVWQMLHSNGTVTSPAFLSRLIRTTMPRTKWMIPKSRAKWMKYLQRRSLTDETNTYVKYLQNKL